MDMSRDTFPFVSASTRVLDPGVLYLFAFYQWRVQTEEYYLISDAMTRILDPEFNTERHTIHSVTLG